MTNIVELRKAYERIAMLFFKKKISGEERNCRIMALNDTSMAEGLSFQQLDAITIQAIQNVVHILEEVYSSQNGRWH